MLYFGSDLGLPLISVLFKASCYCELCRRLWGNNKDYAAVW